MRRALSPFPNARPPGRPTAVGVAALVAVLLLAALALPRPALAQMDSREGIQLQNQILELRRDMQNLRDQMAQGGGGGGSSLGGYRQPAPAAPSGSTSSNDVVASLVDRVARLEDQVRALQGRIDEADNARKNMHDDLQKQIDDMNYKLGGGVAAPGAAPAAPPAAPVLRAPEGKPPRTPEMAMQEGNAALARRDYATAQAAAKEVLAAPRSPRAADAQFLLAQALAGKKDYAGAAVAYDDTYNRAKTGTHAQDALLGVAHSLTAIGEKRAACVTLDKLHTEFPNPRPDLKEPILAARRQAGCR